MSVGDFQLPSLLQSIIHGRPNMLVFMVLHAIFPRRFLARFYYTTLKGWGNEDVSLSYYINIVAIVARFTG
jgi:hypothetical protein